MFGCWTYARTRAAQRALDAGRLEDALEQVLASRGSDEPGAIRVRQDLAVALVGRARLRAAAGDAPAALRDLDGVESLGRLDGDARLLRDRVLNQLRNSAEATAIDQAAVQRVSRDLAAGRLDTAWAGLDQVPDPDARERLRQQVDQKQQRAVELADACRAAIARGDLAGACQTWANAVDRHGRTGAVDAALADLAAACVSASAAALQAGRLDRLQALAPWIARLQREAPMLSEAARLVEMVRACGSALEAGDFVRLREALLRLQSVRPDVSWVRNALRALDDLLTARDRLLTSPLGLVAQPTAEPRPPAADCLDARADETRYPLKRTPADAGAILGRPLLLLIDGTGSFLLLPGERVKIGRAGSSAMLHVPLAADIQSHHADVLHRGEDYFIHAHGPLSLNHAAISHALLRDGDRVGLGERAGFVFRRPSRISDTAALRLASRCRLPGDVSDIILFRGTCLIGPQASCHIRTREGDTRAVLFERDGELFVRRAGRDDRPTGAATPLALRKPCEIGDLRLTVTEYDPNSSGSLA